ncbi:hypothetical protein HDV00_005374 [Rhizophlyctis rosea]|nr:hypothetical protein HDV00_005374 [Rhizophlyctis rosea]
MYGSNFNGELPMVMQVVVTGARNEPEGPVLSGFPGLGGEVYLQGIVRLHNPSRSHIKTIYQVSVALKGTTFSRSPSSTTQHKILILDLSQTPVSRADPSGGAVLPPTSIRDIPFRIDIPSSIVSSLPPSVEFKPSLSQSGVTTATQHESGTRYELTVTVYGHNNEVQARCLRIRVPSFPAPLVLRFSAEDAIRYEGVSSSSTIAYSMSHPSVIIPGRVFPFEFRLAFPGDKKRKYADRLQKVRFELRERVCLFGAAGEKWESTSTLISWFRVVPKGHTEHWSHGVYGPVFTDKVFLKTPLWPFPSPSNTTTSSTSTSPDVKPTTHLSIIPTSQTPCITVSHTVIITVISAKTDDMTFEKDVTILPCTPTMMEELTGEYPWLIVEASEKDGGEDGVGSGSGGGGGGAGGVLGAGGGEMDEEEMVRRAIEASMRDSRGGAGGSGGGVGGVDVGGPSGRAGEGPTLEEEEDENVRRAILESMREVGMDVGGGGGVEELMDEVRRVQVEEKRGKGVVDGVPSRTSTLSSVQSGGSADVVRKLTQGSQSSGGSSPRMPPGGVAALASPHVAPASVPAGLPVSIPDILPPAYADVVAEFGIRDPASLPLSSATITDPSEVDSKKPDAKRPRHPVIHPYAPLRDDELSLEIGDVIEVLESFDDGWCLGLKLGTNDKGFVPGNSLGEVYTGEEIVPPHPHPIIQDSKSTPTPQLQQSSIAGPIDPITPLSPMSPSSVGTITPETAGVIPGYSATPLQAAESELERLLAGGEISGMEYLKRRDIIRAAWKEASVVVGGGGGQEVAVVGLKEG